MMSKATRISLALFAFGVIFGVIFVSYLAGSGNNQPDAQRSRRATPPISITESLATVEALTTSSGSAIEVVTTSTP